MSSNTNSYNGKFAPDAVKRISNCFITAFGAKLIGVLIKRPVKLHLTKSARGVPHVYWTDEVGRAWEFYSHGSGQRSFFENLLYIGHVRRATERDILQS